MLNKYYGVSFGGSYSSSSSVISDKDLFYPSIDWEVFNINGKSYQATLDNLKQNLFPALKTNVTDALNKILIGEGVIQSKPTPVVTIQQVVSTTPINVTASNKTSSVGDNIKDIVAIGQLSPAQQAAITASLNKGADIVTAVNSASLTKSQADAINTVSKATGGEASVKATAPTPPPTQPITAVSTTKDYTKYYLIGGGLIILVIGSILILKK